MPLSVALQHDELPDCHLSALLLPAIASQSCMITPQTIYWVPQTWCALGRSQKVSVRHHEACCHGIQLVFYRTSIVYIAWCLCLSHVSADQFRNLAHSTGCKMPANVAQVLPAGSMYQYPTRCNCRYVCKHHCTYDVCVVCWGLPLGGLTGLLQRVYVQDSMHVSYTVLLCCDLVKHSRAFGRMLERLHATVTSDQSLYFLVALPGDGQNSRNSGRCPCSALCIMPELECHSGVVYCTPRLR
jgi:hypothetical protein